MSDTIPASIKQVAMAHCHEVVACPHCGANVGQRCWYTESRTNRGINKFYVDVGQPRQNGRAFRPHRARWIQLVPGSSRRAA